LDKNKIMMVVIVVLLVVLLGTTAGLAYLLYRNFSGQASAQDEQGAPVDVESLKQEDIVTVPISDTITTNLAVGSDGESSHMAKLALAIGVDTTEKKESDTLVALLTEKEIVIKDLVIEILTSKTHDEFKRVDSRDVVREDILKALQDEFESNLIVTVYIYEWNVI
jgi:flagellar basal body-associated protein FliL